MGRFRERMAVIMQGRYGMDQLGKVLNYGTLGILLVSFGLQSNALYMLGIIGLIFCYYRMFSKKFDKRYKENQIFLNLRYKLVCQKDIILKKYHNSKQFRIFKCPNCEQKIRIPRGKGNISIKCPKCRIEFVKKT